MRVVISKLPNIDWWREGITAYEDNWAMDDGAVSDQERVLDQHRSLIHALSKYVEVVEVPFTNSQHVYCIFFPVFGGKIESKIIK